MPKVVCSLPNTSTLVNGWVFAPTKNGKFMVSEDLPDEAAAHFASIPGFKLIEPPAPPAKVPAAPVEPPVVPPIDPPVDPVVPPVEEKKE